ncbi:hypothetical protein G9A89_010086 [Geosiphon pyriformis]|nr:hypothetical protein G9A89_010086 [Geosiphon pyriformis]
MNLDWGYEFGLAENAGVKSENKNKMSNYLFKAKKNLRDMLRSLDYLPDRGNSSIIDMARMQSTSSFCSAKVLEMSQLLRPLSTVLYKCGQFSLSKCRYVHNDSRVFMGKSLNCQFKIEKQSYHYATEAIAKSKERLPTPGSPVAKTGSKITKIVDQIASLTLLETADLTRLNIQDILMPVGNISNATSAPTTAAPVVEEEKTPEKTEFKVKLEKYDAAAKTKIIREIKNIITGMNLVEAKKFVEGAPKVIKESASKEEAEKIKKTIEALGGFVVLE